MLYNLTDQQRDALLQIVLAASIPGAAAPMVTSIIAALERGVELNADTAERAGVQQADGATGTTAGAATDGDGDSPTA